MKNKFFTKAAALLLSLLMVAGLFTVVSFADDGLPVYTGEKTEVYYNEGVITLKVDAERIGEILTNREFNKAAFEEFIPSGIYQILKTGSKASVINFIFTLIDAGVFNKAEMLRVFNNNEEAMQPYKEMWEYGSNKDKIDAAGGTNVNKHLRKVVTALLLNEINYGYVNGTQVYEGNDIFELDHNALQTAVLQGLPSVAEVAKLQDGDEVVNYHLTTVGDNVNFDFTVRVVAQGDCKDIRYHAGKFVDILSYTVEDSGTVKVTLNLDKRASEIYSEVLASDGITDARKLELLGLYGAGPDALVSEIANKHDDESAAIGEIVRAKTPYLVNTFTGIVEKIRDNAEKLASKSDTVANFTTLDDLYQGNGTFVWNVHEEVAMATILGKLDKYPIPEEYLEYLSPDDHVIDVEVTCNIENFYRVSFEGEDGEELYFTYLPGGEDLAFVETAPELAGHGEDGWYDKETYLLTTAMPEKDTVLVETVPETEIEIVKVWNDSNNQDGKRPNTIEVQILNGGEVYTTVTISGLPVEADATTADATLPGNIYQAEVSDDGNTWKTLVNLPAFLDGAEAQYTVTETAVDGYATTIDGYTITNTYTTETVAVEGTKVWVDNDNQDGKRPSTITVTLYANGQKAGETVIRGTGDTWTFSFTNLPKYENGQEITYTVDEAEVAGYTKTVEGYTITNTYTPETTKVEGKVVWDDADNKDKKRPESVTVTLYADGEKAGEVVVDAAANWEFSFDNLPKYKDGQEITYTVGQNEVAGYTTTVEGFVITNKYVPAPPAGERAWIIVALLSLIAGIGAAVVFTKRRRLA